MEKFFWADRVADDLIKRSGGKKEIVCASGITPSGIVHIGNFREVMTTDMVVKALKNKGKKARFIYSWDDYDRFRKVPKGIDPSYEKYLGMPVSGIPSPYNKKLSYAAYFEREFEKSLGIAGIKPKFIYQNEMNKKCKYANLIKKAIDERKKIIKILDKYRKEPLSKEWYPVTVYCEKCKKDIVKILNFEGYMLSYECVCGFKDTFDIRKKGIVSIKWRVDWPLRWSYEGVDFEPGGNDHSVYGGSYTTAKEISKKIFGNEPPIYQFYDFISIKGGGEFSSSEGNALTPAEVLEVYEPEIMRFLFVSIKPKSAFQISFDNDVIKIYEDFDMLEKKYFSGEANGKEKRIYEVSMIKVPKRPPKRTSFRHLITLVQTGKTKGLSKEGKLRAEKVKNWLENHAKEDMKFSVQEKVSNDVSLSDLQKKALDELKFLLKGKGLSEEKLYNEFYSICKNTGIKSQDFFTAAYNVILNKNRGPRLASLITTIGKEKVIKLLEQIR